MADNYTCGVFGGALESPEERIRQLEEEIRRLKGESEAPTETRNYTAANAVAMRSQNIVRQPYWNTERKAMQLPYRPTEEQAREYMQTVLHVRKDVAEEETRKFFRYNDARGWKFSGMTSLNWEGAIQLWINRAEERRGATIYEPHLSEEQRQAEERKSVEKEIDVEARLYVDRIRHKYIDGDTEEIISMMITGNFSEDRRGHIAKRAGEILIDLWARTYAEKIIMEDYNNEVGKAAKGIKEFLDSGKYSSSWFWHGVEMRVKYYLEHWEKGPGRPIRRLTPITLSDKKDVPEHWKYIKTLMDRGDYSGGAFGARTRNIATKAENNDFSGGEDGQIAEWIVTGKVPTRPSQPASPSQTQPQPLKGIVNKALRNMGAQT